MIGAGGSNHLINLAINNLPFNGVSIDVIGKLRKFIENSKHVLSISYKPTNAQFKKSAKLVIVGILLMGLIGFIISILVSLAISGTI